MRSAPSLAATFSKADLYYAGSLTLDLDLMEAAGMRAFEQVHVVLNISNGQRFASYIIEGERGSGVVCLNGACARLGEVGDLAIAQLTPEEAASFKPIAVHVDEENAITDIDADTSEPSFQMSLA